MTICEEIKDIVNKVNQYTSDGSFGSASNFLYDTLPNVIRRFFKSDDNIKYLVHYTSIDVLFSILSAPAEKDGYFALSSSDLLEKSDENYGFLRMYDTLNSNDPNEGYFFVNESEKINHPFLSNHKDIWGLLESRSSLPAYMASFRGVSELEDVDDLIFWRTYGNEGKGCAIIFPVTFFPDQPLPQQIRYGIKSVHSTLDHLSEIFDLLEKHLDHHEILYTTNSIPKYISSSLSPIPYLHKADAYQFEKEIRVVVSYVDLPEKSSLFSHLINDSLSRSRLRHFANFSELNITNILRSGSIIMLGPTAPSKENLCFVLKRRLEVLGLAGPEIFKSKIHYRS